MTKISVPEQNENLDRVQRGKYVLQTADPAIRKIESQRSSTGDQGQRCSANAWREF
jgi:hypothetical protein